MEPLRANSARTAASNLLGCLLPAAVCLLAVGCNNGRRLQSDLYQRELRLQEDEIYRLEDYIEEYQGIVSSYRCEVADLKRELSAAQRAQAVTPTPTPPKSFGAEETGPSLLRTPTPAELPSPSDGAELPSPATDEAPPFKPDSTPPRDPKPTPDNVPSLDAAPLFEGADAGPSSRTSLASEVREPAPLRQASATALVEPRRFQGPPNPYPSTVGSAEVVSLAGSSPPVEAEPAPAVVGDPSIRLSVEQDSEADSASPAIVAVVSEAEAGSLARYEGAISVMLTDPSIDGRLRRIARWDFTAEEVRDARQTNDQDGSVQLALPIALPAETPTGPPLRLWVRLIDRAGGRRLQAVLVTFTGRPLRLVKSDGLSAHDAVRRLPRTTEQAEEEVASIDTPLDDRQWRPAGEGRRERRLDPALVPASFDSPL